MYVFSVHIACGLCHFCVCITSATVSLLLLLLRLLRLCVHLQVLINLFLLMVPAGMPELSSADEIQYLRDMLMLDMNDAEAWKIFHAEMDSSLKNWFKQLDNTIHIIKHSLG
jgi:hypothetical protein